MRIKFEPKPDITAFEIALILQTTLPFCNYSDCLPEAWEEMRKSNVWRHFAVEKKS